MYDIVLGWFLHLNMMALFCLTGILGVSLYITGKLRMEHEEGRVLEFEINASLKSKPY